MSKETSREWRKDNPERVKENRRRYFKENHEEILKKNRLQREEKRKFVDDYKMSKGCAICGYNKCTKALEFHHSGDSEDKEFEISKAIFMGKPLEKIKEEIKKCDVLCANCHRELHNSLTAG